MIGVKARRTMVGVVVRAEMPCGCYVLASAGGARIDHLGTHGLTTLPVHVCQNWKRHKYQLTELEHDLARRARRWMHRKLLENRK
jgi:hypothetical protein